MITAFPSGQPAPATLVVAPHLDDAVFSAFCLLTRGHPDPQVLTVFAGGPSPAQRTSWDRLSGFENSDQAVTVRTRENDVALATIGLVHHRLPLLDAQYLDGPRRESDAITICDWIRTWLDAAGRGAVIAAPAGAGRQMHPDAGTREKRAAAKRAVRRGLGHVGRPLLDWRARRVARNTPPRAHVDHLFVRDAVCQLLTDGSVESVVLYEDLPYLWGAPADDQVLGLSTRLELDAVVTQESVDRARKAEAMAAYRSQLRYMHLPNGPLDHGMGIPTHERYWQLTRLT